MDEISLHTPLYDLHRELGAVLVPFAGYEMPLHYPMGILGEHLHARSQAVLFDVSHMGQVLVEGNRRVVAMESLVPGDIAALPPGRTRYTLFTNEDGGILDDLMVSNVGNHLRLVINAACRQKDMAHLREKLGHDVTAKLLDDQALLALQGPAAAAVMGRLAPAALALPFMGGCPMEIEGAFCFITRSGYTGEDGFEIAVPSPHAEAFARRLLAEPEVKPAGLGARDSLRLEAGLCLYGNDIYESTSVIEAALAWTISPRRRGEGGYPGDQVIFRQIANGVTRRRVGIKPADKAPARGGTVIVDAAGEPIGMITSGGFGPSVGGPVAMGYVEIAHAAIGTEIGLIVRDKVRPAKVASLPFTPHRYHRS